MRGCGRYLPLPQGISQVIELLVPSLAELGNLDLGVGERRVPRMEELQRALGLVLALFKLP